MKGAKLLFIAVAGGTSTLAQDLPEGLPQIPFHLTARPWRALSVAREDHLEVIEDLCRFTVQHQDARGAVIDPFLHREHQYSTPYLAFAIGTLVREGRGRDLLENGIRAMDHATAGFARGNGGIPDAHGEFFLASLPEALEVYHGHVPAETMQLWQERLATPRDQVVRGGRNNWRTYAMRGEWNRSALGLAKRPEAVAFIEDAWLHATQRERIASDQWNLYQDHTADPESLAVEAVGRRT